MVWKTQGWFLGGGKGKKTKKMSKGHLLGVVDHQVYNVYQDKLGHIDPRNPANETGLQKLNPNPKP